MDNGGFQKLLATNGADNMTPELEAALHTIKVIVISAFIVNTILGGILAVKFIAKR